VAENEVQGEWTLPDGWVWTTIGEAFEVILGQSPPSSSYNTDGTGLPFYQGKAEFGDVYPTPVKWCSEPKKIAEAGDILISVRAPVGPTNLCREKSCIGRGLSAIRPRAGMPNLYFLWGIEQDWQSKATGTTFSAISGKVLREQEVPLAPLPEQRRIVAEIETQFTRLDAGVAALEQVQANLRRYKASALKAACEGRLVPTEAELARAEGRGYESAAQLLARILAERRGRWEAAQWEREIEKAKQKAAKAVRKAAGRPLKRGEKLASKEWQDLSRALYGKYLPKNDRWKQNYKEPALPDTQGSVQLPKGWIWTSLELLAADHRYSLSSGPFGSALGTRDYRESGVPVIRGQNVVDGQLILDNWVYVSEEKAAKLERSIARPGDLVVIAVGSSGRPAIVPPSLPRAVLSQNCNKVTPDTDLILPKYLVFAMQIGSIQEQLNQKTTDTVRKFLSLTNLRQTVIPLPSLPEQYRIVAEVERRLSVVAALEREVEAALAHAARLRRSILKRAFEGRLVPQDPDDEPASVLLERIRAQRETGKKAGKTNRKKKQLRQLELL
jgi:type I restriction enzyme S subunit